MSCTAEALQLLKEQQARDGAPGVDLILKEHDPPAANACRLLTRTLEDDVLRTVPVVGEVTLSGSGRAFSTPLIHFKGHLEGSGHCRACDALKSCTGVAFKLHSITELGADVGILLCMQSAYANVCYVYACRQPMDACGMQYIHPRKIGM